MANIENRLRSLESKLGSSKDSFVLIQYDANKLKQTEIKIGKRVFKKPPDVDPQKYVEGELKHLLSEKLVVVCLPFKEPLKTPVTINCESN